MTIHVVQYPELSPNCCVVCHAHRCDQGWLSLDVDLLDGHAYLCGDCAASVCHAIGGLTADQRAEVEEQLAALREENRGVTDLLEAARAETIRVVPVDEVVPYVKKQPGRPTKTAA